MQKDTEALTASGASIPEVCPTSWFSLFEKINLLYHLDYLFFGFFFLFFLRPFLVIWKFLGWGGIRAAAAGQCHSHRNTGSQLAGSLWQRQILNPLSKARDWAHILTSWILCCALNLLGHSGNSSLDYLELGFLLFEALQVLTDMLSMFKHISFPISS